MQRKETASSQKDHITKDKILEISTRLFSTRGFTAVSMRDIAYEVGIKASSIYNHYDSKEAIAAAIIAKLEVDYHDYFKWLIEENAKAKFAEELIDNMFLELLTVRDISTYYGISFIIKEQYNLLIARSAVARIFFNFSIDAMELQFKNLYENGIVPLSDFRTMSSILMFFVLTMNDLRILESFGTEIPIDCTVTYSRLKSFLLSALKNGMI